MPLDNKSAPSGGMATMRREWVRDRLDVIASMAGIFLGMVILSMNFIYSNEYLVTIGPMLITVCGLYLVFRRRLLAPAREAEGNPTAMLAVSTVFWFALAGSIFSLSLETLHRPPVYFVLTAVAASMITLQILHMRRGSGPWVILLEILIVSLSVRASAFWVFPSIPGSDPWEHMVYIQDFVNSGHIESSRGWTGYLSYPVTHLNATVMTLITGTDIKTAMFLGIGLPLILSTVFVFLVGRSIASTGTGLLAALLVNIADVHVQFGFQTMPTSLGVVLFSIIGYLLVGGGRNRQAGTVSLFILFGLLLIITHTMSAFVALFFVASVLAGTYLYQALCKERTDRHTTAASPTFLLLVTTATLAYWMYAGYSGDGGFFEAVVRGIDYSLAERAGFLNRAPGPTAEHGYVGPILHIAGFLIIYLFGTLGILRWLSRKHANKGRVALAAAIVLMTTFALAFPTLGMRNIMPYRWYAFIYVPLAVAAATGIIAVVRYIHYYKISNLAAAFIVFILTFFMITNRFSNMDSPVYSSELNQRILYTDSEMAAAGKIVEVSDNRWILTDLQYGGRAIGTYMGRAFVASAMLDQEWIERVAPIIIWRNIMAKRPVQVANGTIVLGQSYEQDMENSADLIYSNPTSKAFLTRNK